MSNQEKHIKAVITTAKLYRIREAAKTLCKFNNLDFKEAIAPYQEAIKKVMTQNNVHELRALLIISETDEYNKSDFQQLLYISATVELMEPTV